MNLQSLPTIGSVILFLVFLYNLFKYRGKVKKIETAFGTVEFENVEEEKLTQFKSNVAADVSSMKSNVKFLYIGLLFLWLFSVAASPFYSKFLCSHFTSDNVYNLHVFVFRNVNGQKIPVPNAVIELNNNADNPPTSIEGKSVVMFRQIFSKFPGCECPDENLLKFAIIEEGSGKVSRHEESLSTQWFEQQKNNPSLLEIPLK